MHGPASRPESFQGNTGNLEEIQGKSTIPRSEGNWRRKEARKIGTLKIRYLQYTDLDKD